MKQIFHSDSLYRGFILRTRAGIKSDCLWGLVVLYSIGKKNHREAPGRHKQLSNPAVIISLFSPLPYNCIISSRELLVLPLSRIILQRVYGMALLQGTAETYMYVHDNACSINTTFRQCLVIYLEMGWSCWSLNVMHKMTS